MSRGGRAPNKRFRFPRYIDEKEVMLEYDPVLSHAYTAINTV